MFVLLTCLAPGLAPFREVNKSLYAICKAKSILFSLLLDTCIPSISCLTPAPV